MGLGEERGEILGSVYLIFWQAWPVVEQGKSAKLVAGTQQGMGERRPGEDVLRDPKKHGQGISEATGGSLLQH